MEPLVAEDAASYAQYIEELTSFGLDRLKREPHRLSETRDHLKGELQNLTVREYRAFLANASAVESVTELLTGAADHLDALEGHLPALTDACGQAESRATPLQAQRRRVTLVLDNQAALLELLEIPQLLETCVQSGYYDEALELVQHARRLRTRFGHVALIASISDEVARLCDHLVAQLIALLRTDVKLPVCLRVTGYLRRTDYFSDTQLRLVFLQARETLLQKQLRAIDATDVATRLKRHMDCCRDHLFDIITQYRATFSEAAGRDNAVLHGWVLRQSQHFLQTLTRDLVLVTDGAALASLQTQAMYFGLSLGRVGADIRIFLVAPFEDAVRRLVGGILTAGSKRFAADLCAPLPATPPTAPAASPDMPHLKLLDHPPLGLLCNAFVAATNELRQFAPVSLADELASMYRAELASALADAKDAGRSDLVRPLVDLLAPFVANALGSVYTSRAAHIAECICANLGQEQ